MSGIEVAGIVLAAFPLAISAYEHYRGVARNFNRLFAFEKEHGRSLKDVKDERLEFRLHLKQLLLSLQTTTSIGPDDINELLDDPAGSKWKELDIDTAMRHRLGEAYESYIDTLVELQLQILGLLKQLGYDGENHNALIAKTPQKDRHAVFRALRETCQYQLRRISFCFSRKEHSETLALIADKRAKLDRLFQRTGALAQLHESSQVAVAPKVVRRLLQYWKHADRIYALLYQSWGCDCHKGSSGHCARLWLQHKGKEEFEFKLLVLFAPKGTNSSILSPWSQQGLRIQQIVESAPVNVMVPFQQSLAPLIPQPNLINSKKGKELDKRRKMVRFQKKTSPTPPSRITHGPTTVSDVSEREHKRPKPQIAQDADQMAPMLQEIDALCQAMSIDSMATTCIGTLKDESIGAKYIVHAQPEDKTAAEEIALSEILGENPARRTQLSLLDRFTVALAIASSHTKLQSTKWAHEQWDSSDILFPYVASRDPSIDLNKPYVCADFSHIPGNPQVPNRQQRCFASLGIILLELLFSQTFENCDLWLRYSLQNQQASRGHRLMIARAWADSADEMAPPEYNNAIKWCLNESPSSLEGEKWRKTLAERVVLPLEICVKWLTPD